MKYNIVHCNSYICYKYCKNSFTQECAKNASQVETTIDSLYFFLSDEAEISSFAVAGQDSNNTIVLSSGVTVTFFCDVSSNPNANITIVYENNQKASILQNSQLVYQIQESKCDDSGMYACEASNNINTVPAKATVQLFVRCKFFSPANSSMIGSFYAATAIY